MNEINSSYATSQPHALHAMTGSAVAPFSVSTIGADHLEPFLDKEYREAYLDEFVKSSIAYQILALRNKVGMAQKEFAAKLGTTQSIVSRLENAEYGAETLNTLLKIAKRNGVALDVRFIDYPSMLSLGVGEKLTKVNNIVESYTQYKHAEVVGVPQTISLSLYNPIIVVVVNSASGAEKWQIDPPLLVSPPSP
jgi:transcriptional regulator with XRE-family HTH domain